MKNKYTHCVDCEFHKVIPDPDLTDSFNYDDVAVVCTKSKNEKQNTNDERHVANRQEFKMITVLCRPYQTRKETEVPDWCPDKFRVIKDKLEKFNE